MAETKTITLNALLQDCQAAYERMSANNPHRQLIALCAQVLIQQGALLAEYETAAQMAKPAETTGLVLTDA